MDSVLVAEERMQNSVDQALGSSDDGVTTRMKTYQ